MSLVNCPECKNQVSDAARTCPHCGIRMKTCCTGGGVHGRLMSTAALFLCVVAFVILVIFCNKTVNVNSNNGFINFHSNKRGIFPRLRFSCRCNCGGKR